MTRRLFAWFSAAMLAAGMWMAILVGAGVAVASPDGDSGSSASASSDSSDSSDSDDAKPDPDEPPTNEQDSAHQTGDEATPKGDSESVEPETGSATTDDDATTEEPVESEPDEQLVVPEGDRDDEPETGSGTTVRPEVKTAPTQAAQSAIESEAVAEPPSTGEAVLSAPESAAAVTEQPEASSLASSDEAPPEPGAAQPATEMFAFAAAPNSLATAANRPSVLDLLGTVVFNVFTLGFRLFQGPPVLPAGSTVTVHTSSLELRPGYRVPADWYVPENADPDRLIYFQHGFITNSRSYSYTLAALADETHSIVVAPSVTSNFFATDAFWLAGTPMQEAIANLFVGDRDALTASATRALGYDVTLPQRVVLVGHSYAGQVLVGVASDMVDNGTIDDVAGIVLLDGVTNDPDLPALDNLPSTLPVYNLSSRDSFFSGYGGLSRALADARPGTFNGFQLAGGSHVDTMQGGNPVVQFIANIFTSPTRPENVGAAKLVIIGWVNDMFDPSTPHGIYAAPGATIEISTGAGSATVTSVPVPSKPLGLLDQILLAFGNFAVDRFFNFEPTGGPLVLF